mmetsp:Transcript_18725/g.51432  ORF Transcript_18725/g.51432 Transcript_18725/m.51432 type:complete len:413 (+) Transcript_18725:207-1445(+)|eukprot:CAMPEP_0117510548 /NCGR_PEP_ID=MMETSP0784-20121206/28046_1 /TAXON_ID=39447 /ORGANISM="" /LENGTH=412 /DNA_ID=CAMNT_0005306187 /DNA_START=203 /DNA_END=1441 /DNA_ORIENTATION=+
MKRKRAQSGGPGVTAAELPPQEALVVDAARARWERALVRCAELRPVLQREQELIREILGCGFHGGDLKTLRWLVTGGDRSEADALRQDCVVAGMVAETDKLYRILRENHRALVELTARMPQDRRAILVELDEARSGLRAVQNATHSKLLRAKEGLDRELVCSLGRLLNDLRALLRKLEADRNEVTRNSRLAMLVVAACRRVLPAREVDPAKLCDIPPSQEGYFRIMDFYFFSDASKYCFEECYSGPNWFTRLKRNVAILAVLDSDKRCTYNQFAVSGVHRKPGAPLAPDDGLLQSTEAEDEHGRVFDRRNDAEFKLLSEFASRFAGRRITGSGTLWTSKALCRSCAGAVRQFREVFPGVSLAVIEGENRPGNTERESPVEASQPLAEASPQAKLPKCSAATAEGVLCSELVQ